jgi:two-component sensor histidine kinase
MFLPYLWLIVAYVFLVWADYHPVTMTYHEIAVVVGLMIGMVVIRQALSISETTRLSQQLQVELEERQKAEKLLIASQDELEDRVQKRTAELLSANYQLEIEVEERRIAELRLQASLAEKDVLLKEVHHRVKNNLQVIISMLKLQSSQIEDPVMLIAMQDSQNRVQSMALIHEKLYQSADLAKIDFAGYLGSLANFLMRSYTPSEKQIALRVEAEPVQLGIDAAVPCGLIVNELVSNALKHAFPNGNGGEVAIQLKPSNNGQVEMSIADNGVGLPKNIDLENSPSLGLQLVNALVGQLDGTLELHSGQGTRFTLRFSAAN